jgi:hypothetical protein
MKLTAKCDIEAPLAYVFQTVTDFPSWERAAVRRGAEVERTADVPMEGVGTAWRLNFLYRGKKRTCVIKVAKIVPDQAIGFDLDSPSLAGGSVIEFQALSPRRTRVKVALTVKPKTLAARLFVNTLRLAKGRVTKKFDARVEQMGADIEDRFVRSQLVTAKG